ncbi:ESPR-type extended signal peptide-containing protein, partial [Achromobacter arsenitoxydans]
MNRIYRIVFNRSAGVWQVAGEHARGHGKSRGRSRALGAMVALAAACGSPMAWGQSTVIVSGDVLPLNAAGWNASVDLMLGNTGAGEITVLNGGRLYSAAVGIGTGPGGVGRATVTGSTSSWSVYRDLSIGAGGIGTLNLVDGGSLVVVGGGIVSLAPVAGGTGTINIGAAPGAAPALAGTLSADELRFGAGMGTLNFNTSSSTTFSTRLASGAPGAGAINHYAGTTFLTGDSAGFQGVVNVRGGQLRILDNLGSAEARIDGGAAAGNTAGVLVAGADAEWTIADNLFVGGTGQGWLTIQNGGLVSNRFGSVNATQNGAAQVTVSASSWNNSLALLVGADGGGGTVSVQNQGQLTSVDGYVGRNAGADGSVTVRGAGSAWTNSGFLRVGDMGGKGLLSIQNGGVVSNTDSIVGSMDGSVGNVEVRGAGAVWNNLGSMTLGYGLGVNAGTLTVADGGEVNVGASGTGAIALAPSAFLFYRPSGTINIGGQAGQAAAGAGAINASAIQFGAGDATVNFNHTDAGYRFTAALDSGTNSGASHRVNQIAGTTVLAGANGGFKGKTTVSGGKLVVLGTLGGSAEVTGGVLQYGDGATGAANSLFGNLSVTGAGSTLAVQRPATLAVAGGISLSGGSVLDIASGGTGPSVVADRVTLGNGAEFRLSGISDKTGLDAVLIDTARGISGDFSAVTVGGFAGEVDYLTVHTGKSADGLQYRATYDLSWTAANNLAHGAFTLTNASDRFDLGVALSDQAANPATGWNGKTLTKAGAGTLVLSGDNRYTGGTVIAGGVVEVSRDANLGDAAGGLSFQGGALTATASFDTARAITLAQDGRFDVAAGATLGLAGTVSGGADLIMRGAGTLRLDNAGNAYGNTWIQAGTLVGSASSIRGNVVNDGALVFEQAADGAFDGAISGG